MATETDGTKKPGEGGAAALKAAVKQLTPVPEDETVLPDRPWSVNLNCKNNLVERYGAEGAEVMYRRVALKHASFDPAQEPGYRPDLAPGDAIGEKLDGK